MTQFFSKLVTLLTLLLSTTASAQDVTTSIVELSMGAGYYHFDSNRDLDDGLFWGMGLGMHFSRSYAVVVNYSKAYSQEKYGAGNDVKARKFHLDGLRFFNTEKPLRPFVVFGFGNTDITEGGSDKYDETHLNAGIGLHYQLTPNWSVRGDIRDFYSIDSETNDQTAMVTVGYRFAEGEWAQ